jgi:hypothetical protein
VSKHELKVVDAGLTVFEAGHEHQSEASLKKCLFVRLELLFSLPQSLNESHLALD